MRPSFALDLAPDGIRLLFRAEGGWTVMGDVAPDDPALATRLAALREDALGIAPDGVTTELVIPPCQIRYTSVPAPGAEPAEAAIREIAAGLTPLAPEDLALDWEIDDGTLRLALLDRTTLDEAEAFAEAHGFTPLSFTARPTRDQFPRPPDFGATAHATGAAAPAEVPAPQPQPAGPPSPSAGPSETPVVGAEALALSLSAPRPGQDEASGGARRPRLPALPSRLRLPLAGGAVVALFAVAWLGLQDNAPPDPASLLPDIPPDIALSAPDLAPPGTEDAAALEQPRIADGDPALAEAASVSIPEIGNVPVADTAAPTPMTDADPVGLVAGSTNLSTGPRAPALPAIEGTEGIYLASIDPVTRARDAVALPASGSLLAAPRPAAQLPPPPFGTTYEFGEDGLVRATPEGAFTPEGIVVTDGRPPLLPPAAPARTADIELEPSEIAQALPAFRPRARPGDLVEQNERAMFGGRTRAQMAALRPEARPVSEQALAEAGQPSTPTEYAVTASLVPRDRPADLASRAATAAAIAAALAAPGPAPAAPAPPPAEAAAPPSAEDDGEPEVVRAAPNIPTSASVARQATIERAIRLRDINLIGVFGTERDRRALVRLSNGRYVKVKVGDRLDGGQIAAIGRDQLRYVKGGRNITLSVPSG